MCKVNRLASAAGFAFVILFLVAPLSHSLEKQLASVYHSRRVALGAKLHGGVAVLFAAEEAQLDFMPYRQDEDFYYLTGWNEPGAALLIVAEPDARASANPARVQRDSVSAHAQPAPGKIHRGQAGCGFAGRGRDGRRGYGAADDGAGREY